MTLSGRLKHNFQFCYESASGRPRSRKFTLMCRRTAFVVFFINIDDTLFDKQFQVIQVTVECRYMGWKCQVLKNNKQFMWLLNRYVQLFPEVDIVLSACSGLSFSHSSASRYSTVADLKNCSATVLGVSPLNEHVNQWISKFWMSPREQWANRFIQSTWSLRALIRLSIESTFANMYLTQCRCPSIADRWTWIEPNKHETR